MAHMLVGVLILQIFSHGSDWSAHMEDILYQDKVIYRANTKYQHLVITERIVNPEAPSVLTFLINGRTQFSTADEHIYHSLLTYPALAASARQKKILVIGGGDGLAVRDILRWQPEEVILLDLDKDLIELFKTPEIQSGKTGTTGSIVNQRLIDANKGAFNDKRVSTVFGDAFLTIDHFIQQGEVFDTIIIDLPDPNHPNLNKLFSAQFYAKTLSLLAGDGAMVVQSSSPYHAKNTFMCIGKTVKHAGFLHVEQYHHNVPSFGEWGFTIATKNGKSAKQRLQLLETMPVDDHWMTKPLMLATFEFSKMFYANIDTIKINRIGSMMAYQYHRDDWQMRLGIYQGTEALPDSLSPD